MEVHLADKRAIEIVPEARQKIQRIVDKKRIEALVAKRAEKARRRLEKAVRDMELAKGRVKKWKAKVAYYNKKLGK